jgi:hypothetical protein
VQLDDGRVELLAVFDEKTGMVVVAAEANAVRPMADGCSGLRVMVEAIINKLNIKINFVIKKIKLIHKFNLLIKLIEI